MKVQPRARIGIIVFLLYLVVFYGVWIINGIDYNNIGANATTILKWYVAPLAAGAVMLAIAATVLGWWGPALRETVKAPSWTLIPPLLMCLLAIVVLFIKDYSETTSAMVLLLVLGSVGVGFCEEMATRGLLIVGLRGSMTEGKVWLVSSVLFGLLHLPNWAFGAGPAAAFQVLLAFMSGTTFYLLRRGTGSLVAAMVLHGFWDFSTFIGKTDSLLPFVNVGISVLSLILVLVLFRVRRDDDLAPYRAHEAAAA
jgi:uncharacterized protein